MTSMPASRRARATTLAPRSWPASPGFATSTRIGRETSLIVALPRAGTGVVLVELDQHAARRPGVDEGGGTAVEPAPRPLVHDLVARGRQARQRGPQVRHAEAEVMQPFPPPFEEAAHWRVGVEGLQDLQASSRPAQEGDAEALPGRGDGRARLEAEDVDVQPERAGGIAHGERHVVDRGAS